MKTPKILVVLSNANDGCSWYRGIGPWSLIDKAGLAEVWYNPRPSWQDVRSVDALWMLRPCTKELKPAAQAAKDFGVPLIVDYDDDLLDVATDNPSHKFFAQPDIQQNYREFIQHADLVVASTDYLGKRLAEHNKNVAVIRNALDSTFKRYPRIEKQNNSVLWRGSSTHNRDVASVAPEIVQCADAFPAFLWIFMGNDPAPWAVSEKIKKALRVPHLELIPYFKSLHALAPRIVMVPLADTSFNRCKSNIAAIEGALAGAAVVAPDWDEWHMPGVINYKNPQDFATVLKQLMTDQGYAQKNGKLLWEHVSTELTVERANASRMEIITQQMERARG